MTPDAVVGASSGRGAGWHDLADGDLLVVERHSLELTVESTGPVLSAAP